jgi:hypothetical protein
MMARSASAPFKKKLKENLQYLKIYFILNTLRRPAKIILSGLSSSLAKEPFF